MSGSITWRRALLVTGALALLWAAAVSITGGFAIRMPWGRLSSRDATRPLMVAMAAGAWYAAQFRENAGTDLGFLTRMRWPRTIAALASLIALIIGIHSGTFVASSADASGYVSQAAMWGHGRLSAPMPAWVANAPWPDAGFTAAPLGYRPSVDGRELVPTYAPGLPLSMAALHSMAGPSGVYFVVPLLGAVAVWATYLLGCALAGAWTGAAASALLVASPVFLFMVVQPMSDVPVVAFWALALVWALRPGNVHALLAGAATSCAIATRPNLLPLAVVVAAIVIACGAPGSRWRRCLGFAAASAVSIAFVAALNWRWYGSPLRSGYGSLDELYALRQFWPNLQRYSRWLLQTQTPFALLFFAAPLVVPTSVSRARVWLAFIVFPAVSLALYVFYNPFEEWWYLRFLLPAFPSVLTGLAAVIVGGPQFVLPRRAAAVVSAVLLVAIGARTVVYARGAHVLDIAPGEQRYLRVAEYTSGLPQRSVFVGVNHTGSLRFYARRDVLRWEALDPGGLDVAVRYLREQGYDVYLVADSAEVDPFRRRFGAMNTVHDLDTGQAGAPAPGVVVYALGGSSPPPSSH